MVKSKLNRVSAVSVISVVIILFTFTERKVHSHAGLSGSASFSATWDNFDYWVGVIKTTIEILKLEITDSKSIE